MEQFETDSVEETLALGQWFAGRLALGDCVALEGQLGSGKTVFARGVALGLGLADGRMVHSPTFVLMREYPARLPVAHLDAYRLADPEAELLDLGFEEMLATSVVLLEWGERAAGLLPPGTWHVAIGITGRTSRSFGISRSPSVKGTD